MASPQTTSLLVEVGWLARLVVGLHSVVIHSNNWGERSEPRIGEVNANSVCLYVCVSSTDRPVGRIAHAQKQAKHML